MRLPVPTLGVAPETWSVDRNKSVFRLVDERSTSGDEELLTVSHLTGVSRRADKNVTMFMAESLEGYKCCHPGDLVINTMWAWMGALGVSSYAGIVSPSYHVYRLRDPERHYPRFFDYLFRTPAYVVEITRNSRGVWKSRLRLYPEEFLDMEVWLPPRRTQKAIADFLDRKTAAIDALIEKKQKLLELLAEKRAALINQTVTKGLDPNVPMKDSGIPWIGEIPAHWKLLRLKQIAKLFRGRFTHRPRNDPQLYGGQHPFLQTGDIARADRYINKYSQSLNDRGLSTSLKFPAGTIVMAIAANVGDVAITEFDACFPDSVLGFEPSSLVSTNYLFVILEGMRDVLVENSSENTQKNLNIELVGNLLAPVPPVGEQLNISRRTEGYQQYASKVQSHIQSQLDRLKEYRQALITAAVTGQLDIPTEPA